MTDAKNMPDLGEIQTESTLLEALLNAAEHLDLAFSGIGNPKERGMLTAVIHAAAIMARAQAEKIEVLHDAQ
jgi:hypothetical protein